MSDEPEPALTHLDAHGRARMVDVGDKDVTAREAVATALVRMHADTLALLRGGHAPKGDVLAVARVAGIQAAKKTPELIPLCHAIALSSVEVAFEWLEPDAVRVEAKARARDRTGVEMEALT
ncbi:MAG TPA: cyclic pyranopterin monophosphate synthase MoaC, partial [Sandaracinaceae bacterium]